MNNPILSIVIPTVQYTKYLDETIESCLDLNLSINIEVIVSVNNESIESYNQSKYFQNSNIIWKCLETIPVNMADSMNRAISFATADWLFVLSDDDLILDGFLDGIDIDKLSTNSLYATRINIINNNNEVQRENPAYSKLRYSKEEALNLFFDKKFHNHISLFLFNKKLFYKIKKFQLMGYPNGYYMDTVFHGKILANCDYVYTSDKVVFSRRESSTQGSSKFYFEKEINDYFMKIVDSYFEDENFKIEALKRFKSKKNFYRYMIQNRFYTEWGKLHKSVYNKSIKKKFEFLYKFFMYWKTGVRFKMYIIFYLVAWKTKKSIPKAIKISIKKYLGK